MKSKVVVIILCLLIIIMVTSSVIYYILSPSRPSIYEHYYFEKVGVVGSFYYKDIVSTKGMPDKVVKIKDGLNVYYNGLMFVFDAKKDNDYFLRYIDVTGKQYRFGVNSIGIGTPRVQIENAYTNIQKIIDLPKGEFGAIDDYNVWIEFSFDSKDLVSKISFSYGP